MPQVSKRYLQEEKILKIFDLFFDLMSQINNKKRAENIFTEFLTSTEKIMLGKRIACYYLLYKKIPIRQISDVLKLSTSTILYLRYFFDNSTYIKKFLEQRMRTEKVKNFFEDFFVEMYYGMPKKGSDWKRDKKIYFRHQEKRKEPF